MNNDLYKALQAEIKAYTPGVLRRYALTLLAEQRDLRSERDQYKAMYYEQKAVADKLNDRLRESWIKFCNIFTRDEQLAFMRDRVVTLEREVGELRGTREAKGVDDRKNKEGKKEVSDRYNDSNPRANI